MRVLAVLHPGGGQSGLLGERAATHGHDLVEWIPAHGDRLPGPLAAFDALVVFGGGMNVRDAGRLPWMAGEIELLRDAVESGLPTLGICLGAQLLAAAGGAEVHRAASPEIGWFVVERTAPDPVLDALPERFDAYEWHSYAFELPAGGVALAHSEVCMQAFRLRERAWGVQFHPEVTRAIIRHWALDYESDPDAIAMGFDPAAHMALAEERLPPWNELARRLFDAFLRAAAAAAGPPPARMAAARSAPGPPLPRG
jgi:GMP synthase (glutamine-hydrolysing)